MPDHQTTTLILAGGKGKRLEGADKGLLDLVNQPLVNHSAALAVQASQIRVLANRNLKQYEALGYQCVADNKPDYAGPMVAIWQVAQILRTEYLLVLPCDMPLLPVDLTSRLLAPIVAGDAIATYASNNARSHYCCMATRLDAVQNITEAPRSMRHLLTQLDAIAIEFNTDPQLFLNINTKQDLAAAEVIKRGFTEG